MTYRRTMWRMSGIETLIFIAAVVIAVAVILRLLASSLTAVGADEYNLHRSTCFGAARCPQASRAGIWRNENTVRCGSWVMPR